MDDTFFEPNESGRTSQSKVTESAHTKLSTNNVLGRDIRKTQELCTVPFSVPQVESDTYHSDHHALDGCSLSNDSVTITAVVCPSFLELEVYPGFPRLVTFNFASLCIIKFPCAMFGEYINISTSLTYFTRLGGTRSCHNFGLPPLQRPAWSQSHRACHCQGVNLKCGGGSQSGRTLNPEKSGEPKGSGQREVGAP